MVSPQLDEISHLITRKLGTTAETFTTPIPECKAISALIPFAVRHKEHGKYLSLDVLLRATRTSEEFIWGRIVPAIFNETSPLTIVLVSPHVDWHNLFLVDRENLITQWAAAASTVPHTEEISQSVVGVLLTASLYSDLQSHIPKGILGWMKKKPPLPPKCRGRKMGTHPNAIGYFRTLGDIKILKPYLLLIWSEWDSPCPSAFLETWMLLTENFGGVGMRRHREDLVKHLDHVLQRLDRGLGYLQQQKPRLHANYVQEAKEEYRRIRELLLQMDRGAETRTRTPPGTIIPSVTMLTSMACTESRLALA